MVFRIQHSNSLVPSEPISCSVLQPPRQGRTSEHATFRLRIGSGSYIKDALRESNHPPSSHSSARTLPVSPSRPAASAAASTRSPAPHSLPTSEYTAYFAMLFPTLASGVFLALLSAPSVLAIRDPQPINTHLPVPAPIPSPFSLAAITTLNIRSDPPVHPRDDVSPSVPSDSPDSPGPLRPTRARPERPRRAPAPAAYEHINPTDLPTRTLTQTDQIAPRARALTNAQRLANGLPPLAPRRARARIAHAPRQSPKPCTNPTGTLSVTDVDTGAGVPFGQVGSMANAFGEYGIGGVESGSALNVVLLQCNSEGAPFEVQTTNGLANFTFFGGIVGFGSIDDNISDANSNYVYVGGTSEVSPGPAQDAPNGFTEATGTERDIESALWTLEAGNLLTMNWINTDGTPAQGAHLLYVANANAIVLTGNVDLFRARFGPAPEVTLTFVADK